MRRHYFWRSLFMFLLVLFIAEKVLDFSIHITKAAIPVLLIVWGVSILSRNSRHRNRYRDDGNWQSYDNYRGDYNYNNNNNNNNNNNSYNSDVNKYHNNSGYKQSGQNQYEGNYNDSRQGNNNNYNNNNYNNSNNNSNNNNNYNNSNYNNQNSGYNDNGYFGSYKKNVIFSSGDIIANGRERKYDIIFGDGKIDLSRLPMPVENRSMKVDVIFSNGVIRINEDIPAVIRGKSVFSNVRMPDNSSVSFGETTYVTRSFREGAPHYYIVIDTVFGNAELFSVKRN